MFQVSFAVILCAVLIINLTEGCTPSLTTTSGTHARLNRSRICRGDLIFEELFNTFDLRLWHHEYRVDGCGNGEFEQYLNDRSISFIRDGKLYIRPKVIGDGPTHQGYFNPVQSARMTTSGHFSFKYGKLEARAQVPAGDWIWPAIWLLPQYSKYGTWPRSGEIDVMESRGNKNLVAWGGNIGTQLSTSTLHWGRGSSENQFLKTHYVKRNPRGYDVAYHNYGVEWTPDFMAFTVDGQEIGRITPPSGGFYQFAQMTGENPWSRGSKMAPFDEEFFLILNVAVGATSGYFPDDSINPNGKPWKNSSPQPARDFWNGNWQWRPTWNEQTNENQRALKIEYIRVWAL